MYATVAACPVGAIDSETTQIRTHQTGGAPMRRLIFRGVIFQPRAMPYFEPSIEIGSGS